MTTSHWEYAEVPEMSMGDRIRKARRFKGQKVSQQEIAQAITQTGVNVSPQAVANWETGANDIDGAIRERVAIAVALRTGVPREWILTGDAPRRPLNPGPGGPSVGKTFSCKSRRPAATPGRYQTGIQQAA